MTGPLMSLRVDVPRRITERGQGAVTYASLYLIGAAVTVLLLLVVALNRIVLKPLARVTRHAVAVGEGTDLSAPPGTFRGRTRSPCWRANSIEWSSAWRTRGGNSSISRSRPDSPNSPRGCCTISAMP